MKLLDAEPCRLPPDPIPGRHGGPSPHETPDAHDRPGRNSTSSATARPTGTPRGAIRARGHSAQRYRPRRRPSSTASCCASCSQRDGSEPRRLALARLAAEPHPRDHGARPRRLRARRRRRWSSTTASVEVSSASTKGHLAVELPDDPGGHAQCRQARGKLLGLPPGRGRKLRGPVGTGPSGARDLPGPSVIVAHGGILRICRHLVEGLRSEADRQLADPPGCAHVLFEGR